MVRTFQTGERLTHWLFDDFVVVTHLLWIDWFAEWPGIFVVHKLVEYLLTHLFE